jgi:hypothetical protein
MRMPFGLSRRSALHGITAGAVAVTAATLDRRHVAAQPTTPTAGHQHPVVGTWRITAAPPAPPLGLATYHADGTLVFLFPSPFPEADPGGPLGYQSPAYGVWESTGERSAAITGIHLNVDSEGTFTGTLTFWGTVEVDESGDAYQFSGGFEIADPSGAVQLSDSAATEGERVHVRRDPVQAGTPAASS